MERLRFAGVTGAPLAGVFHPPRPTDPRTGVRGSLLVVHCFACSKELNVTSRLARGLASAGFAVLRFDFTGLGESGVTSRPPPCRPTSATSPGPWPACRSAGRDRSG
jgi:putative redox protein